MSGLPADSLETALRQRILRPLARLRRRCRLYLLLDAAARLLPALLLALLAQLLLDRWLKLGPDQRAVLSAASAAALAWLGWRWLLRPLLLPLSDRRLAAAVDRAHAGLHDQLATAVQFAAGQVGDAANHSPALVRAVIAEACRSAATVGFLDVLDHARARRRALRLAALLAVALVPAGLMRDTLGIWLRRNWFLEEVPWPQWTRIRPLGFDRAGRRRLPRGEQLQIVAEISGRTPKTALLHWRSASGRAGREPMTFLGKRRLAAALGVLSEDVRFFITGGDERTREYAVVAGERPAVVRTRARIVPPEYTGLEAVTVEQQTVLELLAASTLEIEAWFNKPVRQAEFRGAAGPAGRCELLSPQRARLAWSEPRSGSFHFALLDADGWDNRRAVRFALKVVGDQPPEVRMELAGVGRFVTPRAVLSLRLEFSDTYGLGAVGLHVQRGDDPPLALPVAGFQPAQRELRAAVRFSLQSHGAAPGQTWRFWAAASDRDPRGPNIGRTAAAELRVLSPADFLDRMARRELELRREFERLLSAQRGLKEMLERLLPPASPATGPARPLRQQFTGLSRRQDSYAAQCLSLRSRFEQLLARMRTSRAVGLVEQRRLRQRISAPLERLGGQAMPAAAAAIAALGRGAAAPRRAALLAGQREILAQMRSILAAMRKREGYRETVALLEEVISRQRELRAATLRALQRELEQILGPREVRPPAEGREP